MVRNVSKPTYICTLEDGHVFSLNWYQSLAKDSYNCCKLDPKNYQHFLNSTERYLIHSISHASCTNDLHGMTVNSRGDTPFLMDKLRKSNTSTYHTISVSDILRHTVPKSTVRGTNSAHRGCGSSSKRENGEQLT